VDQYYARGPARVQTSAGGCAAAISLHRLEGRLDRIAAATMVLWGRRPVGTHCPGPCACHGITRSAFVSVPRAGHSVQEEAPDE